MTKDFECDTMYLRSKGEVNMSYMIVRSSKSELESVKRMNKYLYDLEEENYELLEIFEHIDDEVSEMEDEHHSELEDAEYYEEELEEIKRELRKLVGRVKRWRKLDEEKKDIVIEELQRISF